ncbi:hypothetical protein BGX34_006939 [Mortierella sp. NVP85]|nr:hypothetical protein BGX34_006939 [Mortierella sp. NVP85]
MEKDSEVNLRSRKERHAIQRALGFKNMVIYVLVFFIFLLCAKIAVGGSNKNSGSLAALAATEPEGEGGDASSPEFWIKMGLIVFLVLIGGVFAGLTIGLMGLDETNLHVLMASGTPKEQAHAATVYKLLSRGKHWVLVTLLLGNVIVNETLPVVLDSELGGGIVAILISTLLIVVFGEIIPQAVCARYGLAIGAYSSKPLLVLMYLFSPVAYPIAMLLDSWLGVHHGTTYRRTELKTLVSLHQVDRIGELTDDEVTIIASVLDLKEKPISAVMTPLDDVFTLSENAILNEQLMEEIVSAGYSRIPIYRDDDPTNFIGMLLVKRLITYDPQDHLPVRQFTINSLPAAAPNTSCLDILNFFQEGRSHMALVTSGTSGLGDPSGVITLEDVIEELLGEEIVDESDVYVDVRNKIKVIRRPSKNVNMIKNLKSLLQSPAISEATPLLGNATAKGGQPGDGYMTTGKTIIQTRQPSTAQLIDPATTATIAKTANTANTATSASKDAHGAANGSTNAAAAVTAISAAGTEHSNGDGAHKATANGAKDSHVVSFKEDAEEITPRDISTSLHKPVQGNVMIIDVPEADSPYPIGKLAEDASATINAAAVESALVPAQTESSAVQATESAVVSTSTAESAIVHAAIVEPVVLESTSTLTTTVVEPTKIESTETETAASETRTVEAVEAVEAVETKATATIVETTPTGSETTTVTATRLEETAVAETTTTTTATLEAASATVEASTTESAPALQAAVEIPEASSSSSGAIPESEPTNTAATAETTEGGGGGGGASPSAPGKKKKKKGKKK